MRYTDIPQPKDKGILLRDILQPKEEIDKKYYLSNIALARINRKIYSNPQINPDKTGTLNTKNNSGQLSVDSGTTLVSDRGSGGSIKISKTGKSGPLSARPGCAWDMALGVLNNNGNLVVADEKANCLDAHYGAGMDNHSQRTMIYLSEPRHKHGENRYYEDKAPIIQARYGTGGDNIPYVNNLRRLTPI